MRQALTDQIAKNLPCPDEKPFVIYWDAKLSGFGLRVTKQGTRAWIVDYRCNGKQRRLTVGPFMRRKDQQIVWGCGAARDEARQIIKDAYAGKDRMEPRQAQRNASTVNDLWRKYEQEELPRSVPRRQTDVRTMWKKNVLPEIGYKNITSVTRQDIAQIHMSITNNGQIIKANRVLGSIVRVFNFAIECGLLEKNPAEHIRRNSEPLRERYLNAEELRRLHQQLRLAANRMHVEVIQTALLTGARRGEVLQMRWKDIDLDEGIWTKPATMIKQGRKTGRSHRVVLNGPVIALLRKREATSDWVFPGKHGKPVAHVNGTWDKVRKEAGIEDVRFHDLRHTYASILATGGESLKVIGDLLGHSNPATTNRYAHLADQAQRAATDRVGQIIEAAEIEEKSEVVPLNRSLPLKRT